jgi:triacylglycerol lipase
MTQVYLVPGFFGFTELGSFNYFNRVFEVFGEALAEHSVDAEIVETDTLPTGSIRRRAIRLLEVVRDHRGLEHENLHFVGHSTGGLDIRMLLTPGVQLLPTGEEQEIAARTRTAITVSTPHYGTPLAGFFTSLNGRYLLYVLTLLATSRPGRYGLYIASRFLSTLAGLDRFIGQEENILDSFAENVLRKLRPERGDELWKFIEQISQDQGAMVQLTPESMDMFNAAAPDRKGIEYVSFVSASPPPSLREFVLRVAGSQS